MLKIDFLCPLPNGLHARPAYELKEQCNPFDSEITFINHRLHQQADAKSSLALIGTGTLFNDQCSLQIQGHDEEKAFRVLDSYIRHRFADSDSEPEAPILVNNTQPLPPSLARFNPQLITGRGLAAGIGRGTLLIGGHSNLDMYRSQPATVQDKVLLEHSVVALAEQLNTRLASLEGQSKTIINAHLSLIQDKEFTRNILLHMEQLKCSLAVAAIENMDQVCGKLALSASEYLRERVSDIQDITGQLLQVAYPQVRVTSAIHLRQPTIIAADDLTPSQFLSLDKTLLSGLILAKTGRTSHTLILARAYNVPVLTAIEIEALRPFDGQEIFIDGDRGIIVTEPNEGVRGYFQTALQLEEKQQKRLLNQAGRPAQTKDGHLLGIGANIGTAHEAPAAFSYGAQCIGLFRTEMLFMDRDEAPDEQEQFEAYQQVLMNAGERPVIFRTMDIGGDKRISYLNIPQEENPYLGYRAVRIYPEFANLLRIQLRAILRAGTYGYARLMIPMVHSLDEIIWIKQQIAAASESLKQEGLRHVERIELGIMVEVPSVCFIIDHFCDEVDFFSIGSNDMTQYLYAVDRNNQQVAHLYNPITPPFLRMLKQVIDTAHQRERWVGLCGELGGETRYLPLLLGLGLDEISMSGGRIPAVKELLGQLPLEVCQTLAQQACECRNTAEIEALLDQLVLPAEQKELLAIENIIIPAELTNKEQVIQYLCGNLYINGRTNHPQELEEDIWQREDIVTTGVGFGFAIPHTKSSQVKHSSISIARLPQPIDWQSEMGEVDFVIMLTLGAQEAVSHVKVFSQLARKLVKKDFRAALREATSADEVLALLQNELAF